MAGRPKDPDEILAPFAEEYRRVYGDGLEAIVLYGSAARGEYDRKRSDINFLIVLDDEAILDLEKAFDSVKRWEKRGVAIPIFLTRSYIDGVLDSYPLEFLDMKSAYQTVCGEDVLAGLEIRRESVRLQCEKEARGHLLHLRRGYLASGGKGGPLRNLVEASLPGYYALFRGLAWLLGRGETLSPKEATRRVCDRFGLNREVFEELERIRLGEKRGRLEMVRIVDRYLEEARKLVLTVDRMGAEMQSGGDSEDANDR